ncbi:S-adenosyl-L-methionine-dependent methyltransferase [Lactarius pseudohatsudake]|nr:S-adenosyl-L-methionine-dependent methyltransferase [Lactarius pseudohatsudake]
MSRLPRFEPIVLITSAPPGSHGRDKRKEPASVQGTLTRGSGKKMRLGPRPGLELGSGIPSAKVEVLLPPLGSWKNRLLGRSEKDSELHGTLKLSAHAQQTVVTPRVYDLSVTMFQQKFRVMKPIKQGVLKSYSHCLNFSEIHGVSLTMKWIGVPSIYSAIRIGRTVYQPGDVVIVLPGEDPHRTRQKNSHASSSQSINPLAENWFIRICYLFERKGQQFLHGQWLAHGSKTLLQEAAHSNGLFLMNSCDNIPLASIIQKCNLHWLAPDEKEPPEDGFNRFYCSGLIWDEDLGAFIEAAQTPPLVSPDACAICDSQAAQKEIQTPALNFGSFSYLGANFHELDFIYALHEEDEDAPYLIGQVLSFTSGHADQVPQVQIRQLEHYDDLIGPESRKKDEQRLYFTLKTESIPIKNIVGKCYVQHPSAIQDLGLWLCHEDHFYVQDCSVKPPFIKVEDCNDLRVMDLASHSYCVDCYEKHMEGISEQKLFVQSHQPLQALELFSGAGGLSIGLEDSGFVETRWAIEYAPSAARTFWYNKQHANVYNQDCNILLEHAIETDNGKKLAPLQSLDDGQPLPTLPKPGEVDLICGGPPCQGFSHANRHPHPDDPRNSLVCNMLSFTEFYKPKFFLLENVLGLLDHKLKVKKPGRQEGDVVANGIIKFILRALTSLGYQVRFNVLQAGVYGSPQNRRRIIIWGARRGIPLPDFPIPTHYFETTQWNVQLDTGLRLEPVTRDPERPHRGAPLRAVTVDDAISDLPKFDWYVTSPFTIVLFVDVIRDGRKNPHVVIKATRDEKAGAKRRAAVAIPAFEAASGQCDIDEDPFPGYPDGVSYASAPRTRYQARAREGIAEDADVELHYTARYSETVVERVCNVAIKPGADGRTLPGQLQVKKPDGAAKTSSRDTRYSRVDGGGHFRTAMTTVTPNSQGSTVIHPSQKRVLTVRECARAQGFPDTWKFLSVSERPSTIVRDQLRQIGNAVPVPLSRALGRALGKALIKMWEAEDKARESGSPEL